MSAAKDYKSNGPSAAHGCNNIGACNDCNIIITSHANEKIKMCASATNESNTIGMSCDNDNNTVGWSATNDSNTIGASCDNDNNIVGWFATNDSNTSGVSRDNDSNIVGWSATNDSNTTGVSRDNDTNTVGWSANNEHNTTVTYSACNKIDGIVPVAESDSIVMRTCAMIDINEPSIGRIKHGSAEYICIDCWYSLCEHCSIYHTACALQMKSHVVKRLQDVSKSDLDEQKRRQESQCSLHSNQERVLFCPKCEEIICPLCLVTSHVTHGCVKMIDKVDEITSTAKVILQNYESDLHRTTESKARFNEYYEQILNDITLKRSQAKEQLKAAFDMLDEEIERQTKSCVNHLADEIAYGKHQFEAFQDELISQRNTLENKLLHFQTSPISAKTYADLYRQCSMTIPNKQVLENIHHTLPPDVVQWKTDIDAWLQTLMTSLSIHRFKFTMS